MTKETSNSGASEQIPSHILDLMLNVILEVMQAESGSIMLLDEGKKDLTIKSAQGLKRKIIENARVRLGSGISGKVAASGEAVYLSGINGDRRSNIKPDDLVKPGVESSYIIPIKLNGGTLGTVNLNSLKGSVESFHEKKVLVQGVLERFIEYLIQSDLPHSHHEPPSQLYMMNVFREYNTIRELRIVFDYIFQLATGLLGTRQRGFFLLKNPESDYFDLVLGYGFETLGYRQIYEELVPSFRAPAIEAVRDIRVFSRSEFPLTPENLFKEDYFILMPLIHQEKNLLLGQMVVLADEEPSVDEERKGTLRSVCEKAAVTIHETNVGGKFNEIAETDSLTSTYNYGLWWKRLHEEFSRVQRKRSAELSLIIFDVDRFDRFNLSHGYLVGDQLLRFIADKIKGCVRPMDVVGRIGGEEFGVVLVDASKEIALMVAERILAAVSLLPAEMRVDLKHPVSLSGGIAGYPEDAEVPGELVEKANTAIVSAKIMGGNRIKIFDHMEE